ncbi:DUF742 domain-containing protein [Streptomyces millisiae]|uniref:DUF742 domain-containing protein n=1 Tax=Streptomyces millisiae TaxID=3075542 RepID=A0ABU2LYE8_9ACTN|nr:DUF742 domain-containing protein [Streptomyces sp. DSM 44918]MDT0322629.1 DUF742 domain-containing protein [Streptomyces sp. DSM 44918]
MATPPGGPYGNEYPAQPHGGARPGRFNFPSAPSGSRPRPTPERRTPPPREPGHGADAGPASTPGAARPPGDSGGRGGRGGQDDWQPPATRRPGHQRRPLDGEPQQPLVRPYAMTGGRTRPRYQLAIEALVSTTADPVQLQGQLPEHQRICQLCYEVKSVAEVSALLSLPLGVARILVADLAEAGLVAIHQPGHDGDPGGQPDVTLLERVLSGLRKL